MVKRSQIVSKAREYRGTPFQHQGRLKGRSCDCVGLVLMVADELSIKDKNGVPIKGSDNANYSAQPMGRFVHEECQRRLREKPISEMKEGDVVTLRVSTPCHVAIISTVNGVTGMIHAYAPFGKVTEHIMDAKWRKRIEGVFEFEEVED